MQKLNWLLLFLLTITVINYPTPFNPKSGGIVTFECTPDSTLTAQLYIYDLAARLVAKKNYALTASTVSRATWDGYTNDNQLAGNGVYLYRIVDPTSHTSLAKGKLWIINK